MDDFGNESLTVGWDITQTAPPSTSGHIYELWPPNPILWCMFNLWCPHVLTPVCVCAEVSIAKAMYNYAATINKEFDFKAEDIITVMDMPLDGW